MAQGNFAQALVAVLAHEGGYVDHPKDPGGATNLGVTIGTLTGWLGRQATKAEVRALNRETVAPIYRRNYWDKVRGDDLPGGLDYAVFDYAVNSGPGRAAMALQRLVGVADDGEIGPLTLAAVAKRNPADLIAGLCDERMAFLRRLSTFSTFGKGWTSRVSGARAKALELAKGGVSPDAVPKPSKPITLPSAKPPRSNLGDLLKGWFAKMAVNHVAQQLKDTPVMNSNLLHNLLNIAIAVVAILSLPEVLNLLPTDFGLAIAGGLGAVKVLINVLRDGLGGLVKEQPPVR